MFDSDRLSICGVFDARNIVGMLEATGVALDPVEWELVYELRGLYDEFGPSRCVEKFCASGSAAVGTRSLGGEPLTGGPRRC